MINLPVLPIWDITKFIMIYLNKLFVLRIVVLSMLSLCSPRFGIAHALCLGLAPWLAAEIPILVDSGMIKHKDDAATSSES